MGDQPLNGPHPLLEIACFDEHSAILAASAGADRIELCKDYDSGGLSPDTAVLENLKAKLTIPVYVMIRPHADTFCYQDSDFETMKETLVDLKSRGADGFVFGILMPYRQGTDQSPSPRVDVPRNKELVQLAGGLPCTFHRAFDLISESEWQGALRDIMDCGFASILTNGGPSGTSAIDCVDKLAFLVSWKDDQVARSQPVDQIIPKIIVGGGVRASNMSRLRKGTSASVFHSAALSTGVEGISTAEVMGMKHHLSAQAVFE